MTVAANHPNVLIINSATKHALGYGTYSNPWHVKALPEVPDVLRNCNITCAQDEALKLLTGMQSMALGQHVLDVSASRETGSLNVATKPITEHH